MCWPPAELVAGVIRWSFTRSGLPMLVGRRRTGDSSNEKSFGSILGVEVELPRKSYSTKIVTLDDETETEKVDGGTNISVTIRWSQKLLYCNGQLTLDVPFSFPDFVTPAGKKISKKEKIQLNVNSGPGTEVLCKTTSHPLKERQRQPGKLGFFYESEVLNWSSGNFVFLYTAMEMFSCAQQQIPIVFLITDGAVEDERHIYDVLKSHLMQNQMISPRLYTFGIGLFCNHYFLRMLAVASRGHYNAAYDVDSIEIRMEQLFSRASSVILANIAFENLDGLEEFEVFPTPIPDLSSEGPLVMSGRYRGVFPESLKAKGVLADLSNFSLDLKAIQAKDMPLDKVLARQQVELLTAQAWLTENKDLEQKIAQTSIQNGVISEYTRMILIETDRGKVVTESTSKRKVSTAPKKIEETKLQKRILLQNHGPGFGNCSATVENIPPGATETKPETAEILAKAASNCCGKMCDICCCMCCARICSRMNDQCAIVLTQFLGSLACLGCFACCELCCSGNDG
ncbi:hypothetical protein T459_19205 [Capsicum annuum]|uniref:VWFA domain-containing protein n=1 Tax=Capsicum annuum TaxID=4072 RepID=A0A2G2Z123_CAPAN|nr:hypothetical protein T459_19205 [Capsicum annuum]